MHGTVSLSEKATNSVSMVSVSHTAKSLWRPEASRRPTGKGAEVLPDSHSPEPSMRKRTSALMGSPAALRSVNTTVLKLSATTFSGRSQLKAVGLVPIGTLTSPVRVSPPTSVTSAVATML